MFSKREREGYVMIDHRESPGFSCDEVVGNIAPFIPVSAGAFFEGATNTCSHCTKVVIMNPDRVRHRGWCWSCDHYICDQCGIEMNVSGVCNSFDRRIEQQIERDRQAASIIIA